MKDTILLQKIDRLLEEIKKHRPLSQGEILELQKSLKVEFTYNSNALEGNTLTRGETKLVIEDGLTIAGKTIREINETLNHNELFEILYATVKEKTPLDEAFILKVHKFVLKNIDDENAGMYRKIQVYISGDEKMPTAPSEIHLAMEDLLKWFNTHKDKIAPVLLAAEFHYRFVKIHPFIDGNGRTVRILMNVVLMQQGFPLVIIPMVRRTEYISSLNSVAPKSKFITFFLDVGHENLKDYLRMISPEK